MNILVVAAHPDDELLGVSGTILRHVSSGDSVDILIAGEGSTARSTQREVGANKQELDHLEEAAIRVARLSGCNTPTFLQMPDNRLDSLCQLDITKKIEEVKNIKSPDVIYTHHSNDLNLDHRILHEAVLTAFRPLPDTKASTLLSFETLSSTEWGVDGGKFNPNYYVDISDFLDRKLELLKNYESEMRDFPHPRSYEAVSALAKLRGSHCGVQAAEAFRVIRHVEK